jgi:hypothetical protein
MQDFHAIRFGFDWRFRHRSGFTQVELLEFLSGYTSRGHVCGFYGKAILFESKARKQAHSKLCNCFRNAAIGQKSASEIRKCGSAKYINFTRY